VEAAARFEREALFLRALDGSLADREELAAQDEPSIVVLGISRTSRRERVEVAFRERFVARGSTPAFA
jgi:hypothetical protein